MRLYNPASGAEYTTASDDELHVQVYLDAGFEKAPEQEQRPGYEPEPVRYEPVKAKQRRGKADPAKGEETPTD